MIIEKYEFRDEYLILECIDCKTKPYKKETINIKYYEINYFVVPGKNNPKNFKIYLNDSSSYIFFNSTENKINYKQLSNELKKHNVKLKNNHAMFENNLIVVIILLPIVLLLTILFLYIFGIYPFNNNTSSIDSKNNDSSKVVSKYKDFCIYAAKEKVKQKLKNPNVAEFDDIVVYVAKYDYCEVGGKVTSTNSYGARITNDFMFTEDKSGKKSVSIY